MKVIHVRGFIYLMSLVALSCAKGPSAEQMWDAAKALHEEEKFEECIAKYGELIAKHPDDPLAVRARFTMADIYANSIKDFEAAIREYKKVREDYPGSEEGAKALFMIGYLYGNSVVDLEKARDAYTEFLERYPEHELVGAVEFEKENLGKDIDDIEALKVISGAKGN